MKIYLIRHGIASEKIGGAIRYDAQRPLTEEGIAELKAVGRGLSKLDVKPGIIISSPLVRTRQTAEILRNELKIAEEVKLADALAPGGNPKDVFKFARQFDKHDELVLVGHEPDVGNLVTSLLWAGPEVEIPFKKAGVCRVDVNDLPPSYPGVLKWFLTPKIAAALGS